MCPVVFLALGFSILMLLLEVTAALQITFIPSTIKKLEEGETREVKFFLAPENEQVISTNIYSEQPVVADITSNSTIYFNTSQFNEGYNGTFDLQGKFLGFADIRINTSVQKGDGTIIQMLSEPFKVSVIRKNSLMAKVFVISVAVLVSLNYINMGCALDLSIVKSVLVRPIAPVLGLLCQFVVMPLVAYGVGQGLFSDQHDLQLGLFTFGCSPGGGASNMWTVLLAGNLNLSITLTFISTAAALLMMPFWLFTLGSILFKASISDIPFSNILYSLISMVVPLAIGLVIQRYKPKVAQFCRRIIAPASIVMIIYIIIFGTYSNLYMFKIMNWRIILAASLNVWIGFLAAVIVAKVFRLTTEDTIAISVETGVQNTGIAIVLLGFSLHQPSADLASVVPVAASIMTPIPLLVALFVKKIYVCCYPDEKSKGYVQDEDFKQMVTSPSDLSTVSDCTNGHAVH